MATIMGRWRESRQPPKAPLSWADAKGELKGAVAVDADNRVVARIDPKADIYVLTLDGWLWSGLGDTATARFNAVLGSDPRIKQVIEKPVKEFTTMAAAKAEAEEIATMLWLGR